MKKFLAYAILMGWGLTSCQKEAVQIIRDNEEHQVAAVDNRPGVNPLAIVFSKCDNWQVSELRINGSDVSREYNGYKLFICPDNGITMYNNILALNGSWYYRWMDAGANTMVIDFDIEDEPLRYDPVTLAGNLEGDWTILKVRRNFIRAEMAYGREVRVLEIERVIDRE